MVKMGGGGLGMVSLLGPEETKMKTTFHGRNNPYNYEGLKGLFF